MLAGPVPKPVRPDGWQVFISAAAGPEQPRMASRARPDGKQRLPYGLGWPGTVAVPGSAHRRVSKADEGHHPIKPRKRIQHNVPGCTSGSAFRAPLPARTYEQPHYNRGAPGKQGPSTAPHLLSTRCRNAPSVPAPSAPQGQGSDRWSGATRDRLRIAATPRLLRSSLAIATSLPALGRVPRPWGV